MLLISVYSTMEGRNFQIHGVQITGRYISYSENWN